MTRADEFRNRLAGAVRRLLQPIASRLLAWGVTPNQVSAAGVLLNIIAASFVAGGLLPVGGFLYGFASSMDLLDGVLAREGERATRFGAFLDSSLDRISEGVVFAAMAYHFAAVGRPGVAAAVVLGLLGSMMVSYTRARAEGLGVDCKAGIATRAERVVLIGFGMMFGFLEIAVYILLAATAVTVLQRIVHTRGALQD